jgi:hypothetical protein
MFTGAGPVPAALTSLSASYAALGAAARAADDDMSWQPTRCAGWVVRDLLFHCLCDAQRGLVALHTPATGEPDRDSVTYWQGWQSNSAGAANGRRYGRVNASLFSDFDQLRELYLETATALVQCATGIDLDIPIRTQGHVLAAADLLRTLAVEATLHHLDLPAALTELAAPSAAGVAEVRRTLDGLLGHPADPDWDDIRYALVATGRAAPTADERQQLGTDAKRLPLFS